MPFKKNKLIKKIRNSKIMRFIRKTVFKQIVLFSCFAMLLSMFFITKEQTNKLRVEQGDVSNQEIISPKDVVDKLDTIKNRKEAMGKVESIYTYNLSSQVNVKNRINSLFDYIERVKSTIDEPDFEKKINLIIKGTVLELDREDAIVLLNAKQSYLKKLESYIVDIISQAMAKGIKESNLSDSKLVVIENFDNIEDLKNPYKMIGKKVINKYLEPNMFLDVEQTEKAKSDVAKQIEDTVVKKGQVIINKGEVFEARHIAILREAGLLQENNEFNFKVKIGQIFFVLLTLSIFITYLYYLDKKVLKSPKLLLLIMILANIVMILGASLYDVSPFVVPIATATMLITILIDVRVSIFVNVIIAMTLTYSTDINMYSLIIYMFSGLVGAIGAKEANHRYKIFIVGLVVGVVDIALAVSLGLAQELSLYTIFIQSVFGLFNGLMCSVLTIGSLPLWESIFGIITPQKLLDLSNPNTPVLKRLLLEAPGTYHHSIVVGNLSEAAAEAVDADALLARVGSYYHDIGKLKRPYFFKENQFGASNPHDRLKANLSTLIILNHVKDGVEIARKYKLPRVIEDIIRQHHGKTLVAYFYHKAKKEEQDETVLEEDFRYPGPKPQTKEAAIIMLADSVEAAVRSLQEPTKSSIESLIKKIIKGKLEDGQLDESKLTFRDLDIIASKFSVIMLGIFHERIEYPKLDIKDIKGGI